MRLPLRRADALDGREIKRIEGFHFGEVRLAEALPNHRLVARRLLGETTWDLLRPDRPQPADRLGPGLPREEIAAVIARLEEL